MTHRKQPQSLAVGVVLCAALLAPCLPAAAAASGAARASAASSLDAELLIGFPDGDGSRTLLQVVVAVPAAEARLNEYGFYNLELAGELLAGGRTYDRFGYRFDLPAAQQEHAPLALLFERHLRPGRFQLVIEVSDLQSGRGARLERPLEVPRVESMPLDGAGAAPAEAAGGAASVPSLHLLRPPRVATGKQRLTAVVTGDEVAAVAFALDGREVMRRVRPPFSVEVDLGEQPVPRQLRAEALDAAGRVLASDQLELNARGDRFAVHLARPDAAELHSGVVTARVDVESPPGGRVRHVELFLDQERVAVLERQPYSHELVVPPGQLVVLRAVAVLADGTTAEDSVVLNAPRGDRIDVELVELYTAVVDRMGHPVEGLTADDFRVFEEGVEQRLARFEEVDGLPAHVALVIDTSTSMALRLAEVKAAAVAFLRQLVRPRDQVMLVTFDTAPRMRVGLTDDLALLANGLEGLRAQGGTALYDSLAFTLGELEGIRGQRAVVLLSDGIDERSRTKAAEVMELALRSAVTLYTIGIEAPGPLAPVLERDLLAELAERTGGRSFFVEDASELRAAYAEIDRDMRARYLLAYHSTHAGDRSFRLVDVEMAAPRLTPRTILGYYR